MSNLTTFQKLVILLVVWLLLNKGITSPTLSPGKADRVTYVYEKGDTAIPSPVESAIDKLNQRNILATKHEVDTKNGPGEVPAQYKIAVAAAKELPSLVVQAGEKVLKVVKDPKTEEDVLQAVP
jgi:hypothetical protein